MKIKHRLAVVSTALLLPLAFLPGASAAPKPDRGTELAARPCILAILVAWQDKPQEIDHMLRISYRESRYLWWQASRSSIGCLAVNWEAHGPELSKHGVTRDMLYIPTINAYVARILWNQQGYRPWRLTA